MISRPRLQSLPAWIWRQMPWVFVAVILVVNVKLHTGPRLSDPSSVLEDASSQLAYLQVQMHEGGLATRMQSLFPEGFVFANALYGLSNCELARLLPGEAPERAMAISEAIWAADQIDTDAGRAPFAMMAPEPGMYYAGWSSFLNFRILSLEPECGSRVTDRAMGYANWIQHAISDPSSPFPDSYPDQCWPADALVGVASLALHDELCANAVLASCLGGKDKYKGEVASFVKACRERLDPVTGMLPHHVNCSDGYALEGPRGSSTVLGLYFLPWIDTALARTELEGLAKHFGQSRLGLATVREYPRGHGGMGDVDSGPVIWGVGFAATIVGVGAYLRNGELGHAQALSNTVESLGFSWRWGGKRYVAGMMPIADLFLVWGRLQAGIEQANESSELESHGSALTFHVVSLLLMSVLLLWRYRGSLRRGQQGEVSEGKPRGHLDGRP